MTGVMLTNVKTPRDATCKSNLQVRPDAVRCVVRLDAFLGLNDRQALAGSGNVSHRHAATHAQSENEQSVAQQRAALEAEGKAYALSMLRVKSTDDGAMIDLGKVAGRLTKKKGCPDVA